MDRGRGLAVRDNPGTQEFEAIGVLSMLTADPLQVDLEVL